MKYQTKLCLQIRTKKCSSKH